MAKYTDPKLPDPISSMNRNCACGEKHPDPVGVAAREEYDEDNFCKLGRRGRQQGVLQ